MTFRRMLAVLLASVQVAGLGLAAAAEGIGEERILAEDLAPEAAELAAPVEEELLTGEEQAPAELVGFMPAEPDTEVFPDVVREDAAEPLSGDPNEVVDSGECGDNLTWTLYGDGLLEISGEGEMWDYEGTFSPEQSTSTAPWFIYNNYEIRLSLQEGITSIGVGAFFVCSHISGELIIPDTVTSIERFAFFHCSGFTDSLTIPQNVTSIGTYAFNNCSGFTGNLTFPDSLTSIGSSAFQGCNGFTGSLTIPDSVTSIGKYAFYGCGGFTGDLTIPDSVTSIEDYAFYGCSGFTGNPTIPNSATTIGMYSFYGCGFSGILTIPENVSKIGASAFQSCSNIEAAAFEGNAPTVEEDTFSGCANGFTVYCYEKYVSSFITHGGTWNGYPLVVVEEVVFPVNIEITSLPQTEYIAGQALDTSGLKVSVYYDSGDTRELSASGVIIEAEEDNLDLNSLRTGNHTILIKYMGSVTSYNITVFGSTVISIECVDQRTIYYVGDSFYGVKVRVNYDDGTYEILTSGYTVSPETASLNVTSYTVSYQGFIAVKTGIMVQTNPEGFIFSCYTGPTKKLYTVGDSFAPAGLVIHVKNRSGTVVATLSGTDLITLPYIFTDADVSTAGKTTSIFISLVYQNRIYIVAIPELTVNPARDPLTITTQPTSQEVTPGTSVFFTVSVIGGMEPYSFQWQYRTSDITTWVDITSLAGKTDTIFFTALQQHDGNSYRCRITDADENSVLSNKAVLNVREQTLPLTIATQPASQDVSPGTPVSFTVSATGGTEPYTYQWQYLKPGAASWVNVYAASGKTDSYSLTALLRHDGYRYRCRITDADGTSVLSGEALLTVRAPVDPLTVSAQPEDLTVTPGTPVSFTVTAAGGKAPYAYQWQYLKPGAASWVNVYAASGKTETYSLTALLRHDGYQYRCRITDANGNSVLSEAALLTVTSPFKVTYQPEDRTVVSGQSAPFVVAASGGVQPYAYQWQYQKPGTGTWTNVTPASGGDTSCFTVPKAAARHNGWVIRCRIRDAAGSEIYTNLVTLTVNSAQAPVLTQAPAGASATPGETVTFSVRAEGPGKLSYQWQYLKPGASAWVNVSAASGKTQDYSLKVEMRHNGYRYRVVVSSDNGTSTVSGAVYLDVWEEILGAGGMLNGLGSGRPAAEEDPDFGWDLPVLDLSEKEEALWDLGLISEADVLRYADEAE